MEKITTLPIIEEITVVKNPCAVRYCSKNRVAVGGSDGCTIIDLKTKKHTKLFTNNIMNIEIIPASKNNQEMVAYQERDDNKIKSFTCNPHDNTFFSCYGDTKLAIRKQNYITNSYKYIPVEGSFCQYMTIHPNEKTACIADYECRLSFYELDNLQSPLKTMEFSLDTCWFFCRYSRDGSYIVAGDSNKVFIIDPHSNCDKKLYLQFGQELLRNIAFHPNNSVVAILSKTNSSIKKKQIVRYFDIKMKQFIDTPLEYEADESSDLDFSADGLELIVALEDRCVRTQVLFAIKEKSYFWWVLKQLKEKEDLPQDVINYLLKTF